MQVEVGAVVEGTVTGITKFGAFVSLPDGRSGLVHISEIANTYVNDVNEYHLKEIKHFFEQYKALEPGKEVLPGDYWTGAAKAEEEIVAARKRLAESEAE